MLLWQDCWAGESYFCHILQYSRQRKCHKLKFSVLVWLRWSFGLVAWRGHCYKKKDIFRRGSFFSYRHQRALLIVLFLLGLLCHSWQAVCSSPTTKQFFKQRWSTNVTPLSHTHTHAGTHTNPRQSSCLHSMLHDITTRGFDPVSWLGGCCRIADQVQRSQTCAKRWHQHVQRSR